MDSLIRWKKGDYIKLGQAVSRFNKIINELEIDGKEYLPDSLKYDDVKKHITSRKELNRVLKSLRSANVENLTATKSFESGEVISDWEFREITKARKRAFKNLELERQNILKGRESIGMGDERLSEIHAIEQSFIDLKDRTGSGLKRLKQRIMQVGRTDYKLSKDVLFRENFYKALDGIKNFKNYDLLKKELDKIKNPSKFYEAVKKSTILMDLFLWYKEPEVNVYGSFSSNQEAIDFAMLFDLDIVETEV